MRPNQFGPRPRKRMDYDTANALVTLGVALFLGTILILTGLYGS